MGVGKETLARANWPTKSDMEILLDWKKQLFYLIFQKEVTGSQVIGKYFHVLVMLVFLFVKVSILVNHRILYLIFTILLILL